MYGFQGLAYRARLDGGRDLALLVEIESAGGAGAGVALSVEGSLAREELRGGQGAVVGARVRGAHSLHLALVVSKPRGCCRPGRLSNLVRMDIQGLGFRVWGFGFWGLGVRGQGFECRV